MSHRVDTMELSSRLWYSNRILDMNNEHHFSGHDKRPRLSNTFRYLTGKDNGNVLCRPRQRPARIPIVVSVHNFEDCRSQRWLRLEPLVGAPFRSVLLLSGLCRPHVVKGCPGDAGCMSIITSVNMEGYAPRCPNAACQSSDGSIGGGRCFFWSPKRGRRG